MFSWIGEYGMSRHGHCSGVSHSQAQLDHHANQLNPNSDAFRAAMDNHANQLNPNNSAYNGD